MPITFQGGKSAPGSRTFRVLCYGDSLTAGFCANGQFFEPYGRTLAEALSRAVGGAACEVTVCGRSGALAREMAEDLDAARVRDVCGIAAKGLRAILSDQAERLPDLVLIMAGTNDLGKDRRPEAVLEDLRQLHAACHAAGVPTVALPPPPAPSQPATPWERARRQLHGLLASWSRQSQGRVVAFLSPDEMIPAVGGGSTWDPDGLHLAPAGSRKLGEKLAPVLAPLLCQIGKSK